MKSKRLDNTMFLILLGDALFFFTSLWLALVVRHMAIPLSSFYVEHVFHFIILFGVWTIIFYIAGLYDQELLSVRKSIAETLFTAQAVGAFFAILLFYFIPWFTLTPKTTLALFLIIFTVLVFFWRRLILYTLRPPLQEVVLVGDDASFEQACAEHNYYGYIIKQKIAWKDLRKIKSADSSSLVFMNYGHPEFSRNSKEIHDLLFLGFHLYDLREIKERMFGKVSLEEIDYEWFVKKISKPNRSYVFIKRGIDIVAGFGLLVVLLLLLPFIVIAELIEEKRVDLFFNHMRVGRLRKKFIIHKLRTMRIKDTETWSTENHNQVTKVGRILRAFRIDELPQGYNLITGDLSLVGPRAIFEKEQLEMEKVQPYYHLRLYTKPGITGWAQIKQRHAPSNPQEASDRLAYDLFYVQNQSLIMDLLIILKTIKTVLLKLGVR